MDNFKDNDEQNANDESGNSFISNSKASKDDQQFEQAMAIVNRELMVTRDKAGILYGTVPHADGYETMKFGSSRLEREIKKILIKKMKFRPSKLFVTKVSEELEMDADRPDLECHEVYCRVGLGPKGQPLIDLCNERREVVEVDAAGVRLVTYVDNIPLFARPSAMRPLPNPIGQTENLDVLREFLNIESDADWRLLVVYLLFCLRPNGPYVILIVTGSAGSAKTTFSRFVRDTIDPSSAPTQSMPRNPDDLIITATHTHLLVLDNVREVSPEMSDMFCCLATGASSRKRTLFTDSDETVLRAVKPCVINGIGDISSQPDLLSRCIHIELPPIKTVRTQEELDRSYAARRPEIFAGLVSALSKTIAELPHVENALNTRMADFAHFGVAVERALKWPPGSFNAAYAENQREQMSNLMGDDALANAIKKLVRDAVDVGSPLTLTPTKLLEVLKRYAAPTQMNSKTWPQSAHSLSKRLKKILPALRACGIGIDFAHSGIRTTTVTRLEGFVDEGYLGGGYLEE